ncbi:MAG TPA: apolipoprotein N-acyltransferase [Acidimicrobiales bacterium]|nr:apolipoprotein N-acyltransferase [Acidimicrobiales bacterium]
MSRTGRALQALAPVGAGALVGLSLPPLGIWPLAVGGVALLAVTLRGRSLGGRAAAGLLAGIGQLAIGLAWALKFTLLGYCALVLLESAIFAVACALAPSGRARVPALAALLTLAEWVRENWPFGGVPPGGIALGQVGGPFVDTARIGGTILLVGVTYLAGVALGDLAAAGLRRVQAHSTTPARGMIGGSLGLAVVVPLAIWGLLAADGGPPVGTLRVAVVQGGGQRGLSDLQVPASVVYAAALRETVLVRQPVDLVLWPEDVVGLAQPFRGSPEAAELSEIARSLHTTLVAGVTEPVGTTRFRNEIVAYGPTGALVAVFEKVHRVPFGEYVPWRSFVSHLANLKDVPRDAIAGRGSGMIKTPAGRFAVLVSYEVFFADRGRSGVRAGSQLILVPTNTSSYSNEQAPAQEIAASRLQAIEEGRDLLQAAPTGYSAVVDNQGNVLAQTQLSVPALLSRTVPLRDGSTLYTRLGDLPTVLLALLSVVVGWALALGERRRRGRAA